MSKQKGDWSWQHTASKLMCTAAVGVAAFGLSGVLLSRAACSFAACAWLTNEPKALSLRFAVARLISMILQAPGYMILSFGSKRATRRLQMGNSPRRERSMIAHLPLRSVVQRLTPIFLAGNSIYRCRTTRSEAYWRSRAIRKKR
jgi:hypothetical protein